MTESANSAELATGSQSQNTQSLWHNNTLLLIVWWGHSLEDLELLQGSSTTGRLVWNHSPNGLVENARWGTEVEWSLLGVVTSHLAKVGMVPHCNTENPSQQKFPMCMSKKKKKKFSLSTHPLFLPLSFHCSLSYYAFLSSPYLHPKKKKKKRRRRKYTRHAKQKTSENENTKIKSSERTLCTEEFAGNVKGFGSHDHNSLAAEQLLSDDASQATKKVPLAVNSHLKER